MSSSSRPPRVTRPLGSDQTGQFERWQPPNMALPRAGRVEDVDACELVPVTAEQIEEIQRLAYQEAYDNGFAEGRAAGMVAGQQIIQQQAEQFSQLIRSLAQPFEDLDDQVVNSLVDLSVMIARNIIRREIKTSPGQIVATVRETIALLPVGARDIRLILHPEDAAFVRETLSVSDEAESWRIVEEPTLTRGGCRVLTENSQIDASIETQVAAVVAQLLGGEREQDASGR